MNANAKILSILAAVLIVTAPSAARAAERASAGGQGTDNPKIEDVIKVVSPAVVRVEARNGGRKVATGVVIDKDGSIVTTALISPRDEEIFVTNAQGRRYKADFKGFDIETHIAVVQVKDKGLQPAALGQAGSLHPGAWIGVVGLSPESTPAVTQGIVSSVAADRLRLNVWVVPGASGSPVVDAAGRMVGLLRGTYIDESPVVFEFRERQAVGSGVVLSRAEAPSAGMALAVPIDIVLSVSGDIRKFGKVERGWLGVSVLETEKGLEIAEVDSKSPAALAKLKAGDLILKIEGRDVQTGQAMSREIRSRKPGMDIVVRIERAGKPLDVKVKLGEYTESDARRELELRFPRLFPDGPQRTSPGAPKIVPFGWEQRKYIGVGLNALNKDLAEALGAKDGYGLLVGELEADSPAKKAGLKVGDIILKADGRKVETVAELSAILQDKKKGDKVKIEFVRDKKPMALDIEVAEDEVSGPVLMRRDSGEDAASFFEWFNRSQGELMKRLTKTDKSAAEKAKKTKNEANAPPKDAAGRTVRVTAGDVDRI